MSNGTIIIPTDYAWSTWTLSNVDDNTASVSLTNYGLDLSQSLIPSAQATASGIYQTITRGDETSINRIKIYLGGITHAVKAAFRINIIKCTNPHTPTVDATVVYGTSNNVSVILSGAYAWYSFDFAVPVDISPYAYYAFQIERVNGLNENHGYSNASSYSGGRSSLGATQDIGFYIYSAKASGTATSPAAGYDAESGNMIMLPSWTQEYGYGLSLEARTADTSAGLSSADWFGIRNDCTLPLSKRKRFMQVRAAFVINADGSLPVLYLLTLGYFTAQPTRETQGFNYSGKGSQGTRDGKFKGRLYTCAISGKVSRRREMKWQRGVLVDKKLADDRPQKQYLGYEKAKIRGG